MVGGRWFLHSLPAALSMRNCILEGDSCILPEGPMGRREGQAAQVREAGDAPERPACLPG